MNQQFLKTIPLFSDLDDEELSQVLMVGLVKRYRPGATILTEGVTGGHLYVIHQGEVRISKLVPGIGEEALTILRPGQFFGEIEFFDGYPASAHAIAHSDCEVLSLPHSEIVGLMQTHPALAAKFLWAFGRTIAIRLRETNQRIASIFAMTRTF